MYNYLFGDKLNQCNCRACVELGRENCDCYECYQTRLYKKAGLLQQIIEHFDDHGWAYSEQCGDYYDELNSLLREAKKVK